MGDEGGALSCGLTRAPALTIPAASSAALNRARALAPEAPPRDQASSRLTSTPSCSSIGSRRGVVGDGKGTGEQLVAVHAAASPRRRAVARLGSPLMKVSTYW